MSQMVYFGFDLGDGESCVTCMIGKNGVPAQVPVGGKISFISAVGKLGGRIAVGDNALHPKAEDTRVCFKRHFPEGTSDSREAIRDFARGVLTDIRNSNIPGVSDVLDDPDGYCFKVGCPAGWSEETRAEYKLLLEEAGLRNVRITSESRAAYEEFYRKNVMDPETRACFNSSVLVIDIGSSTLDFSYVRNGNEFEVEIMGNTLLGGGMMDEMLLLNSVESLEEEEDAVRLRNALRENKNLRSKLMAKTRRMKEIYFTNEADFIAENREYREPVTVVVDGTVRTFDLIISPDIVENFLRHYPHPLLNNQTFDARLQTSLSTLHQKLRAADAEPELVILTGGPSRMSFFRDYCMREFPKARFLRSETPETDISEGLAYLGGQDDAVGQYISEVREYLESGAVSELVQANLQELAASCSEVITDAVYDRAVLPGMRKWKAGDMASLNQMQDAIIQAVPEVVSDPDLQDKIASGTHRWEEGIIEAVQQDLNTKAEACNLRTMPLGLKGFLYKIGGDMKNPVDFDPLRTVNTLLGVLTGAGGALVIGSLFAGEAISGVGLIIAPLVAIILLVAGNNPAFKAGIRGRMMTCNFPRWFRRLIPVENIDTEKNRRAVCDSVRISLLENPGFSGTLVSQITDCINQNVEEFTEKIELQL